MAYTTDVCEPLSHGLPMNSCVCFATKQDKGLMMSVVVTSFSLEVGNHTIFAIIWENIYTDFKSCMVSLY